MADEALADAFGFHALQLGLPAFDALAGNRMPHRWLAVQAGQAVPLSGAGAALSCDFDALPFPSQSIDLVVLPHALEAARDAHLALREVERVLVPEGRVLITGFNPWSFLGLTRRLDRVLNRWRQVQAAGGADGAVSPQGDHAAETVLVCRADRLAFPVRDGVPVMLEEEARTLAADDPLLAR